MPTISATVVKKPRRGYNCAACNARISGAHLRLYGMAWVGEPPYVVRICLPCGVASKDEKTRATAEATK